MLDTMIAGLRALWHAGDATPRRVAALAAYSPSDLLELRDWVSHGQFFHDAHGNPADDDVLLLVSRSLTVALDRRIARSPGQGLEVDLYVVIQRERGREWHIAYQASPLPSVKTEIEWGAEPGSATPLRIKVDRVLLKDSNTRALLYGHVMTPYRVDRMITTLLSNGFVERS